MLCRLIQKNYKTQQLKSTQFNQINIVFCGIYLLMLLLLATAWLQSEVKFSVLFRDTFAVAEVPIYYGLFSNIGICLWVATGAILLFSAAILSNADKLSKYSNFFLSFGSLTLLLAIDDFFLLHERVFPWYLKVSEKITFMIYGIIVLYLIFRFRKIILQNNFKIFITAILFLSLSIAVDLSLSTDSFLFKVEDTYFFEDSLKLIGIVSWCFYFIKISGEKLILLFK
jgi:hypothetical protein